MPEQTYEITSHSCAVAPFGSTVSADVLEGLNVEALIEAGHITPTNPSDGTPPKDSNKSKDEESTDSTSTERN